jgi:hypothetical protein
MHSGLRGPRLDFVRDTPIVQTATLRVFTGLHNVCSGASPGENVGAAVAATAPQKRARRDGPGAQLRRAVRAHRGGQGWGRDAGDRILPCPLSRIPFPQPTNAAANHLRYFFYKKKRYCRHFYWFVGSLRKVGFTGDIVLATNAVLSSSLSNFLKEQQV